MAVPADNLITLFGFVRGQSAGGRGLALIKTVGLVGVHVLPESSSLLAAALPTFAIMSASLN
jgi:hypothetical protein